MWRGSSPCAFVSNHASLEAHSEHTEGRSPRPSVPHSVHSHRHFRSSASVIIADRDRHLALARPDADPDVMAEGRGGFHHWPQRDPVCGAAGCAGRRLWRAVDLMQGRSNCLRRSVTLVEQCQYLFAYPVTFRACCYSLLRAIAVEDPWTTCRTGWRRVLVLRTSARRAVRKRRRGSLRPFHLRGGRPDVLRSHGTVKAVVRQRQAKARMECLPLTAAVENPTTCAGSTHPSGKNGGRARHRHGRTAKSPTGRRRSREERAADSRGSLGARRSRRR